MRCVSLAIGLLLATGAAADESFRTPSGNIHCIMGGTGVRCDILSAERTAGPRPAWCALEWGYAFGVGPSGKGRPICAGDTAADPGAPVLRQGQSRTSGGVTCTTLVSGMTCLNQEGGGFDLSHARQRVF